MEKIPIGLIIRNIIKQKDLDVTQVAKDLGIARNTVYQVFGRNKLSTEDLKQWAAVLGVTIDDITSRQSIEPNVTSFEKLPDDYLTKYVAELEARIKEQSQQLDMQNETIRVLLGKSEVGEHSPSKRLAVALMPFFSRIPA